MSLQFKYNPDNLITVPPRLKQLDTESEPLFMDDYYQMSCSAIHGDHPIQFEWRFRNRTLSSTENIRIEYTKRSSTLSIEAVSGNNAGEYTCIAWNRAGATNASTHLIVKGS